MKLIADNKLSLRQGRILAVLAVAIGVIPVLILADRRPAPQNRGPRMPSQVDAPMNQERANNLGGGKICFVRSGWIYLKDLASQKEKKLVEGVNPNISPSGESLVFLSITEKDETMNRVFLPPGRLRLFTLETMTSRAYDNLRGTRVSAGVWSNNGKLAVTAFDENRNQPSIAMLNPSTGNLEKRITGGWDPLTGAEGIYLDSWVPGDHSVLFHTLSALYEADFETGLVQKVNVGDLFKNGQVSSATKFSLSADRRNLLFDTIIDTVEEPETGIISLYDFTTKTLRQVTPKNIQARSPVWVNNEILFTKVDYVNDRMVFSLCKISVDGTGLTTLVENADRGSYAAQ